MRGDPATEVDQTDSPGDGGPRVDTLVVFGLQRPGGAVWAHAGDGERSPRAKTSVPKGTGEAPSARRIADGAVRIEEPTVAEMQSRGGR